MRPPTPPRAWASAMMWLTSVVFPEDSGPKISTIRPRGTPPMPSARSTASEPVRIEATLIVPLSPRRINEPTPKSRSIWVTAASRAASFAFASFAEASFKFTFFSAISDLTSLLPASGQLDLGQRDVSGAPRLEFRTVKRQSDAIERLFERLRQLRRPSCDRRRTTRSTPLVSHSGDRHMGPEIALLGLVQPFLGQPGLQISLEVAGSRRRRRESEHRGPPGARHRDRILELRQHHLSLGLPDHVGDRLHLGRLAVAEEDERHVQRLGPHRLQRRIDQLLPSPGGD